MALLSRVNFTPRVYCLTLPNTARKSEMEARLNECGLTWEFVYGDDRPSKDSIPWDYVRNSEWLRTYDTHVAGDYVRGVAGCKTGVIRVMEKGINDGEPGFIFCNDDIILCSPFQDAVMGSIRNLPKSVGMLGLCYALKPESLSDTDSSMYLRCNGAIRMEWMCFVRRWFAKEYVKALREEGCESDVCIERWCKRNNADVFVVKHQLAKRSPEANNSIIGYQVGPNIKERAEFVKL